MKGLQVRVLSSASMVASLTEHRIATIMDLGFSRSEAEALEQANRIAVVQDRIYEHRVDHHYLSKLLKQGATHSQIMEILL